MAAVQMSQGRITESQISSETVLHILNVGMVSRVDDDNDTTILSSILFKKENDLFNKRGVRESCLCIKFCNPIVYSSF